MIWWLKFKQWYLRQRILYVAEVIALKAADVQKAQEEFNYGTAVFNRLVKEYKKTGMDLIIQAKPGQVIKEALK